MGGFLTADLIGKIDAHLRKAVRLGYNDNLILLLLQLLQESGCGHETV